MKRWLLVFCLLGIGLTATAQQDSEDRDVGFLAGQLEDLLSGAGRSVQIDGFEGALSSVATIEEIRIADDEGVWLTLRDIELDWNRSALLRRRVEVEHLRAGEIIIPRAPVAEAEAPSAEASGFSLPDLPVSVEIEDVSAARVSLGEPLFGLAVDLEVAASLRLSDGEGEGRISALRLDGPRGEFVVEGSFSNETRVLSVNAGIDEEEGGIAATLIGLPGEPSVDLGISGEGPLSDFSADLQLSTAGEERLAGTLSLDRTDQSGTAFVADLQGDVAPLFLPDFQAFFGRDVSLLVSGRQAQDGTLTLSELSLQAAQLRLGGSVIVGSDGLPDLIDIEGEISDGAGGPVTLPAAGDPLVVTSAEIDVDFDAANAERWAGSVVVTGLERGGVSAERVELVGDGRIEAGDIRRVTADLDVAAQALDLADPNAAQALGQEVNGRASITWQEDRPVEVSAFSVRGGTYEIAGGATISQHDSGAEIDGRVTASAEDLASFSGLAGRDLGGSLNITIEGTTAPVAGTFDARISGTGGDLSVGMEDVDRLLGEETMLEIDVRRTEAGLFIDRLQTSSPAAELTASGDVRTGGGSVTVNGALRDADIIADGLTGPVDLDVQAEGDASIWDVVLNVGSPDFGVSGGVEVNLAGDVPRISGMADVRTEDLSLFADRVGRDIAGSVDLAVNGTLLTDLSTFDATLEGTVTDVQTGFDRVDPLLAGQIALSADAARQGDVIAVRSLEAASDLIDLTASGSLGPSQAIDLDLDLTLPQPRVIAPGLPGPLTVDAQISGAPEAYDVVADVTGPGTNIDADVVVDVSSDAPGADGTVAADIDTLEPFSELAGRDLAGSLELDADGVVRFDLSDLDIRASLRAEDVQSDVPSVDALLRGIVTAEVDAERQGDVITVRALEIGGPALAASADGRVDLAGEAPTVTGRAAVRSDDLAAFAGLADRPLAGSLDVDAEGTAAFDLSAFDVTASIDATDLQTGIAAADGLLRGDVAARFAGVRRGESIEIQRLTIDSVAVDAEVDGEVVLSGDVPRFTGRATLDADSLEPLSGAVGRNLSGAVSAEADGALAFDLSSFDVEATATAQDVGTGIAAVDDLLRGEVTANVDASRDGEAIEVTTLDVDAQAFDASVNGTIGQQSNRLSFDARLADVSRFVSGISGPVSAQGSASQQGGGDWSVDATAQGPGGISATISGSAAQDASRLALDVSGAAPLALADRFIGPRAIDGNARFDLSINGPPALESVSGTISTGGARFVDPLLGFALTDLGANIRLNGGRADVSASAAVAQGGRIAVDGGLGLTGNIPADLAIQLNAITLSDPTLYETTADGRITVNGPLTGGARIAGQIALGETELRIPSTGLSGAGSVPDGLVHVNEPASVRATRRRAGLLEAEGSRGGRAGAGPSYPLDIRITAPNRIFLRGRGLDAELGGSLLLGGNTQNIVPSGQFELVRGRLDILGQRLTLDEGRANLQGDFNPFVRLVAATQSGDVNIRIVIEGEASSPDVLFLSDPDLPEDEVVSRLLFDRGIENLSPLQAAQLASAVATLAGRGGDGIIGRLRQDFGLDDLDVTTSEEGGAAVRAGKYISDNVYTDLEVDSEGEASVTINLDLTPSVTVRGSAGSAGSTGVGVFFEKDY